MNIIYCTCLLTLTLLTSTISMAQIQNIAAILSAYDSEPRQTEQCLSPDERKKINFRIAKAKQDMIEDGLLERLFPSTQRMVPPSLIWPIRQAPHFNDPSYYVISNYVDLDSTTGVLDYNGLSQSYDGHKGIDIRIWPYWWKKMADSHVEAIAAADGVIILKQDGFQDQSCSCSGSWNAVFLMHPDGAITWYGHLKKNTTTAKDSGDLVVAGEYLGIIGSSGCSTNPHLHLEVYDNMGNLIEPFAGPSNPTTESSWWQNQLPYYDSGVNKIATHSSGPTNPACPGIESPNEKDVFDRGEAITFTVAIRHSLNVDSAVLKVFEPDGDQSTILDLTYIRAGGYFVKSVFPRWNRTLDPDEEIGKWTFEVTYYSLTYGVSVLTKEFWVTAPCVTNYNFSNPHTLDRYYEASNTIISTSEIVGNTHVIYDAGNNTTLLPGFIAPPGSRFQVKTSGCN